MSNTQNGRRSPVAGLVAIALSSVLAGCAMSSTSGDFGKALQSNQTAQIINPMAGNRSGQDQSIDGQRAAKAVNSFRKADTKARDQRLIIDLAE